MTGDVAAGPVIDCAGAPRDLGLAQGTALRTDLRACAGRDGVLLAPPVTEAGVRGLAMLERVVAMLREQASVARARRDARYLARDVRRHFPQLAERLEGIARGAAVPAPWLLSRERRATAGSAESLRCEIVEDDGVPRLVFRAAATISLVPRRSAPEGGWRSLEVVTPCGVAALAGVNESGLAAAVTPSPSPSGRPCRVAAPAALLIQECLQRFDAVGPAVAWCFDRPAAGAFDLWLLDARRERARVRTDGESRERMETTRDAAAGSKRDAEWFVQLDPALRRLSLTAPDGSRCRAELVASNDSNPAV